MKLGDFARNCVKTVRAGRGQKTAWRIKVRCALAIGVSSFFTRSVNYSDPNCLKSDSAGGGPAATYLFCFAKKGKPKKATAAPLNSRWLEAKSGKQKKLAALRQLLFLVHF